MHMQTPSIFFLLGFMSRAPRRNVLEPPSSSEIPVVRTTSSPAVVADVDFDVDFDVDVVAGVDVDVVPDVDVDVDEDLDSDVDVDVDADVAGRHRFRL